MNKLYCLSCHQQIISDVNWTNFLIPDRLTSCCKTCEAKLDPILSPSCKMCGREEKKISYQISRKNPIPLPDRLCADCIQWQAKLKSKDLLRCNRSVYHYNAFMRSMIARWKYRGDYEVHQMFASAFQRAFKQYFPTYKIKNTYLVPIPLSKERLNHRAFNQAEALAKLLPLSTVPLLSRTEGEKQSKRNRKQRLTMKNPFTLNHDQIEIIQKNQSLSSQSVVLIDDIYTTGTTLHHAAESLNEVGFKEISSYTLVR